MSLLPEGRLSLRKSDNNILKTNKKLKEKKIYQTCDLLRASKTKKIEKNGNHLSLNALLQVFLWKVQNEIRKHVGDKTEHFIKAENGKL